MIWPQVVLTGLCTAAAGLPLLLARRFSRYVRQWEADTPNADAGARAPRVAVMLPCKGVDPGFEENLATIFQQDLPGLQLIFATATAEDPACEVIRRAMAAYPQVNAKLIHAGLPDACSQQNNNQLAAAAAADDPDIFVVVDSDIQLRSDYLSRLVAPLRDPEVTAATGYRWYSPVEGGLGSWLRSVWNGGALVFMPDQARNFAWGGSMAFRRADFDLPALQALWGSTLSDDHPLSREVRRRGGRIVFVPQCMAVSYEDTPLSETIAWTTRQTLVTRVYNPPFWCSVLLVHGLQTLALLTACGLMLAAAGGALGAGWLLVGGALLLPAAGMALAAGMLVRPVTDILPTRAKDRARPRAWLYVLLTPAASLLCLWNSVASLCTRHMTWRGVTYHMVTSDRTVVKKAA